MTYQLPPREPQTPSLGSWGEQFAEKKLQEKGYTILDRNWRCAEGELDIVCVRNRELVFVEVKTRKKESPYFPLNETVSDDKEKRLYRLAAIYRRMNNYRLRKLRYESCRFDLFGIITDHPDAPLVRHYERAFDGKW